MDYGCTIEEVKILSSASNPQMRHHAPVDGLKTMITQMALTDLHESQNKQQEQNYFMNMGKKTCREKCG